MCLQSCESLPSIHQLLVLEELRLVYGYRKDTGGAGTHRGHTRDTRAHKGTRYTGTRLFKIYVVKFFGPSASFTNLGLGGRVALCYALRRARLI